MNEWIAVFSEQGPWMNSSPSPPSSLFSIWNIRTLDEWTAKQLREEGFKRLLERGFGGKDAQMFIREGGTLKRGSVLCLSSATVVPTDTGTSSIMLPSLCVLGILVLGMRSITLSYP